jgi:hypothetical protein
VATTWVLHTETKGTGAQMVPLEKVQTRPSSAEPIFVPRRRERAAEPPAPAPAQPRQFRIVDVMTRQRLLDAAGIRDALAVLREVRSVVDVNVHMWEQDRDRWRPLTFEEQHAMMDLAAE